MKPAFFKALCGVLLLLAAPALAQNGTFLGAVVARADLRPLAGVRVTATSPALKTEQMAVTDAQGNYRIPQLPPGTYALRFEKESFLPFTKTDLRLKAGGIVRVNVELTSAANPGEPRAVNPFPTVDKGMPPIFQEPSPSIAVERPVNGQDPARTFQSVAPLAPPLHTEAEGIARYLPTYLAPRESPGDPPAWALKQLTPLTEGAQYFYRDSDDSSRSHSKPGSNGVNPTIDTEEDRFSVFFVGVDTTPYAVARDYLQRDVLPDERTVWAESFINSFDYGDSGDVHGPFVIEAEGFPSPSRKGYHVVRITLRAREALPDVDVQVEFDRAAVARYRLVGYERAMPAPESLDEDDEPKTPLAPGQAVTAIYEVKVHGPAIAFGMLRIHYDVAGGTSWRRVQKLLPSSVLRTSYARAAPATRLAYVAAAFAEKLRGSYWTRTLDWARLAALCDDVGEPFHGRPDVVELGALIRKAQGLDKRKDKYEATSPASAMDYDRAPELGN
ncbi:von Willebrand factor type A domain-containing protein [Pyxidicoccus parkwayensis]|uniref:von Willebrand factor type A domain-containing protein n=1 Tax=Pyxidicoccus parkwayensis TaxID=2813578 RepID=A0ABX7NVQ8_9BACT|nr:von Willebrand factor type A domain-containing protein [Pyxidicoccus parkwaysis]QSQ23012.1 von Willebrand factor type A domain-containing protein [Pyxidicoccus parkwaysis]